MTSSQTIVDSFEGTVETDDGSIHHYIATEFSSPVGKTYSIVVDEYEEVGPFRSYSASRAERTFRRWYNTRVLGKKDIED